MDSLSSIAPSSEELESFFSSIRRGKIEDVTALLDKYGKNIVNQIEFTDERAGIGNTPLMLAVWEDRSSVVRLLLDRGADVNARSGVFRQTALMWAALRGFHDTVALLIDKDAPIDATDSDGNTAAKIAERNRYPGIVKMLDEGREMQRKRNILRQRQQELDEARLTQEQMLERLGALKKLKPSKPMLKKTPRPGYKP